MKYNEFKKDYKKNLSKVFQKRGIKFHDFPDRWVRRDYVLHEKGEPMAYLAIARANMREKDA